MQLVMQDLIEKIGYSAAIEVCRRWGGRKLHVPRSMTEAHPLALSLGLEPAKLLVEHFGGEALQLPRERNALIDERNAAIVRAIEVDRLSQETVGVMFGLTRQAVAAVLRKPRPQTVADNNTAPATAESRHG